MSSTIDKIEIFNLDLVFSPVFLLDLLNRAESKPTTVPSEWASGEIKLSLQYHRGALIVMVSHILRQQAVGGLESLLSKND